MIKLKTLLTETISKKEDITKAIVQTYSEYTKNELVKCAYDVGSGLCEEFAESVLEKLGHPSNVDAIEFANLTGKLGCKTCDEIFYSETLKRFGVKVPSNVTIDILNKSGLGSIGTHVFLRWKSPAGYMYFDAEAPNGVDSPFLLPFSKRYLAIV